LIQFVRLHDRIAQGGTRRSAEGQVLQAMAPLQELGAVTFQLPRQLRGGHALGNASHDQDPLPRLSPRAMQDRRGEGVEEAPAGGAAKDQDRRTIGAMDLQAVGAVAAGTGHAVRMQQLDQELVARLFVQEVVQRTIHNRLLVPTPR
jgi:hypothetical protein